MLIKLSSNIYDHLRIFLMVYPVTCNYAYKNVAANHDKKQIKNSCKTIFCLFPFAATVSRTKMLTALSSVSLS